MTSSLDMVFGTRDKRIPPEPWSDRFAFSDDGKEYECKHSDCMAKRENTRKTHGTFAIHNPVQHWQTVHLRDCPPKVFEGVITVFREKEKLYDELVKSHAARAASPKQLREFLVEVTAVHKRPYTWVEKELRDVLKFIMPGFQTYGADTLARDMKKKVEEVFAWIAHNANTTWGMTIAPLSAVIAVASNAAAASSSAAVSSAAAAAVTETSRPPFNANVVLPSIELDGWSAKKMYKYMLYLITGTTQKCVTSTHLIGTQFVAGKNDVPALLRNVEFVLNRVRMLGPLFSVTTDTEATMESLKVKMLEEGHVLYAIKCCLHESQLVIKDVRDNVLFKELREKCLPTDDAPDYLGELVTAISQFTVGVMRSKARRELLTKLQIQSNIQPKMLVLRVATHWSTDFMMLQSVERISMLLVSTSESTLLKLVGADSSELMSAWRPRITVIVDSCKTNIEGPSFLAEVVALLKPLADWTRALQSSSKATMSYVVPMIMHLRAVWAPGAIGATTRSKRAKFIAEQLLRRLNQRMGHYVDTPSLHLAATWLDPLTAPLLRVPHVSAAKQQGYSADAISMIEQIAMKLDPAGVVAPEPLNKKALDPDFVAYASRQGGTAVVSTQPVGPVHVLCNQQLASFLSDRIDAIDSGLTAEEFYAVRDADAWPIVRNIGRQLLFATKPQCSNSEWPASAASDYVTVERNKLKPAPVEATMLVGAWSRGVKAEAAAKAASTKVEVGRKRVRPAPTTLAGLLSETLSTQPPLSPDEIAELQMNALDEAVFEIDTDGGSIVFKELGEDAREENGVEIETTVDVDAAASAVDVAAAAASISAEIVSDE